MNIIERIKWLITPLYEETFELWGCDGVTVAGERFRYEHDKYIRVTGLNCSAPDWIYVDFKRDGCISVEKCSIHQVVQGGYSGRGCSLSSSNRVH